MSDEYLMKRSLGKMSVSDLLDAYAVAWKYEMPGLLTKYCEMLIRNIATVNLFQVSDNLLTITFIQHSMFRLCK